MFGEYATTKRCEGNSTVCKSFFEKGLGRDDFRGQGARS